MIGKTISHYRILEKVGEGGMGVVYRAEDTKLRRIVALKFLPHYSVDSRERFLREAQAAAALDHPNICTIHQIEEAEGKPFLVMALVQGESLKEKIAQRPLKVEDAIEIANQTAQGLQAAHGKGIVHRDIKPANLMINQQGQVKIMDFGLAQLSDAARLTHTATILGTPAYMSPEQAQRLPVDRRSDIWSLGAVLYEMVVGRPPFHGDSEAAVLYAVVHEEHEPITAMRVGVPAELDRIVSKALAKRPEKRYQHADEIKADLQKLKVSVRSGQPSSSFAHRRVVRRTAMLAAGGALITLAAGWFLVAMLRRSSPSASLSWQNPVSRQITSERGEEDDPCLAPNGESIAYTRTVAGNSDIFLQRVGGSNVVNLTKDSRVHDRQPAFSPDGRWIAFRSERDGGGIFVMGATGESVRRLTDSGYYPSWSPSGREIAYSTSGDFRPQARPPTSRLWVVDVGSGKQRRLGEMDAIQPQWSPNGQRIAFATVKGGQRDIATIGAAGGAVKLVTHDPAVDWNPAWSPDGRYLYFASDRGGNMNLWRMPIEESSGEIRQLPEAVTTPSPYTARFSIAARGNQIAFVQEIATNHLHKANLDPVLERVTGPSIELTTGSRRFFFPEPSPDGGSLTFCTLYPPEDILLMRADGTGLRQLTDDAMVDRFPKWSPDGKRIAFQSDRSGTYQIWLINADGSGIRQVTFESDPVVAGVLWSPDGKRLLYNVGGKPPRIIRLDTTWDQQTPERLPLQEGIVPGLWARNWSRDNRMLSMLDREGRSGVVLYSFEQKKYQKVKLKNETFNELGHSVWLSDSRRLLLVHRGEIHLVDTGSGKSRLLLSVAPDAVAGRFSVSSDDRTIYFSLERREADIWLMSAR